MKTLFLLISTVVLSLAAALAAPFEYFDQGAFAANAGQLTIEGFDTLPNGAPLPDGATLSGTEFQSKGFTFSARRITVVTAAGVGLSDLNINSQPNGISAALYYSSPGTAAFDNGDDNFEFTLTSPSRAAGLWIGNLGGRTGDLNPTHVTFYDQQANRIIGQSLDQANPYIQKSEHNNRIFYGIVSDPDKLISRVVVQNGGGDQDAIILDDFQFLPASEPDIEIVSAQIVSAAIGMSGPNLIQFSYRIIGAGPVAPFKVAAFWSTDDLIDAHDTLASGELTMASPSTLSLGLHFAFATLMHGPPSHGRTTASLLLALDYANDVPERNDSNNNAWICPQTGQSDYKVAPQYLVQPLTNPRDWIAEAMRRVELMRAFLGPSLPFVYNPSIVRPSGPGTHDTLEKLDVSVRAPTSWEQLALAAAATGFWVHAEGVVLCGNFYPVSAHGSGSHLDLYNIRPYNSP